MTGSDHHDNLVCLVTQDKEESNLHLRVEELGGLCLAELKPVSCSHVSYGHGAMLCAWQWCCAEAALKHCLLGVRSSEPEVLDLALTGHPGTNCILVPILLHKSIQMPQTLPVNCTENFFASPAAVFGVHLRKFYFGFVSKFGHTWKSLQVIRSLQEGKVVLVVNSTAYKENIVPAVPTLWLDYFPGLSELWQITVKTMSLFFHLQYKVSSYLFCGTIVRPWLSMHFHVYQEIWIWYSVGKNKDPYFCLSFYQLGYIIVIIM